MEQPRNAPDVAGMKELLDAQHSGRYAARTGQHVATCPHPGGELRDAWVRGFAAGLSDLRYPGVGA